MESAPEKLEHNKAVTEAMKNIEEEKLRIEEDYSRKMEEERLSIEESEQQQIAEKNEENGLKVLNP